MVDYSLTSTVALILLTVSLVGLDTESVACANARTVWLPRTTVAYNGSQSIPVTTMYSVTVCEQEDTVNDR